MLPISIFGCKNSCLLTAGLNRYQSSPIKKKHLVSITKGAMEGHIFFPFSIISEKACDTFCFASSAARCRILAYILSASPEEYCFYMLFIRRDMRSIGQKRCAPTQNQPTIDPSNDKSIPTKITMGDDEQRQKSRKWPNTNLLLLRSNDRLRWPTSWQNPQYPPKLTIRYKNQWRKSATAQLRVSRRVH